MTEQLNGYMAAEDYKAAGRKLKRNSIAAMESDLKRFLSCGYSLLCTTSDLERYLSDSAQGLNGKPLSPDTLARFLSSFRKRYRTDNRLTGIADPSQSQSMTDLMAGLYLNHGKPPKQAASLTMEQLQKLYHWLETQAGSNNSELTRLTASRDWALICTAFWRGLRADTIGAIRADAVTVEKECLSIYIPKEKQIKEHKGRVVRFEGWSILNPVPAMQSWLAHNPQREGMLYPAVHYSRGIRYPEKGMNRQQITNLLRGRLLEIGVKNVNRYSAHSFRHSLGKWGGMNLGVRDLMAQGGWSSIKSVERYITDSRRVQSLSRAVKDESLRLLSST